jgi:hypothetical protein
METIGYLVGLMIFVVFIFFYILCAAYFVLMAILTLLCAWTLNKCRLWHLWFQRFYEVFETAAVVLKGNKTALSFMGSKNAQLGMKRPINMLSNDDDATDVIIILWKNFRP